MLEEFDTLYDEAEVTEQDDFATIPDGTYQVFIDDICVKKTKEKQLPMIAWKFKISAGNFKGRVLFKNSVVMEKTIAYIKTDLSVCGMKLKKFSDLYDHIGQLRNLDLEVKVVSKGDNQNVYIQRKLEGIELDAKTEGDIPF